MSYDVDLLYLSGDCDALEEARRLAGEEENAAPSAEETTRRKNLVDELLALHPSLQMRPDSRGFAYGCWIGSEDPECDIPDFDLGIDRGFTSFSYSADEELMSQSLRRILEIFERRGYIAYDPQLDKLISTTQGVSDGARQFKQTRAFVVEQLETRGETVIEPKDSGKKQTP